MRVPCFNAVEDRLGVPIPIWGPSAIVELRRAIAWADVVHVVEALYIPSAMAMAVARRLKKPVVLCQNVGFIRYRQRVLEWIESVAYATLGRAVLLGASHLVLATPSADRFVRELLGDRVRNASTFPIGIDTEAFRPASPSQRADARRSLHLKEGRPVVLFAGRLVEKKGVSIVLGAAAHVPEASFVIAGDGPLRGLLKAASPNVRWLGYVDTARMIELYHAAEVVLLPSQGEGLPLLVQEAMACGRPAVISADEIYAAELLRERVCFGAARDAESMARAVRMALSAPDQSERVRAHAVTHWSLEAMTQRYLAIFDSLLKGSGPPRPDSETHEVR